MQPEISIIIVNWNTRQLLAECLQSLYKTLKGITFEVVVVDNASTDDSLDMLAEAFPSVQVIRNTENVGFPRANNQAMQICCGKYFLLFNSDAVAMPNSIQTMYNLAENQPKAGMVGAQLINPDGSFQASHTRFPNLWQEFLILTGLGRIILGSWYPSQGPQAEKGSQMVDYVEGACMFVRAEAYRQVGGMDEGYFMYAEEVDWCYQLRQGGWQVWYHPEARVIHHGGASSKSRRTQREGDLYRSRVQFFRKHYGALPAFLLKILIFNLTGIKILVHKCINLMSGGRRGRSVISLSDLSQKLKGA